VRDPYAMLCPQCAPKAKRSGVRLSEIHPFLLGPAPRELDQPRFEDLLGAESILLPAALGSDEALCERFDNSPCAEAGPSRDAELSVHRGTLSQVVVGILSPELDPRG